MKLYYYPPGEYDNPYSINFKKALSEYYDLLECDNIHPKFHMLSLYIFKRSFQADIYVLNWIENIGNYRLPFVQWFITFFALLNIKLRGKKIIWMFHNIHPHNGTTFYSSTISWLLFRISSLIVSHSKDAAQYAKAKSRKKVIYRCHPIKTFDNVGLKFEGKVDDCDILIWGNINRYKGIKEFISLPDIQKSNFKILIIGKSDDKLLIEEIKKQCNEHIILQERRGTFAEIGAYCKSSKYVLFPYIGDSISSSGALIDTIAMGGIPIGPEVGAFKDLESEGLCITYKNYQDLYCKLNSSLKIEINDDFFVVNSWDSFVRYLYNLI